MTEQKLQYVTLIWNEIPENMRVYVIPRSAITKQDAKMLKACHGFYVNDARVSDDAVVRDLARLSEMLVHPDRDWLDDDYRNNRAEELEISRGEFDALVGRWNAYEIDIEKPHTLPRSRFYSSGFIL